FRGDVCPTGVQRGGLLELGQGFAPPAANQQRPARIVEHLRALRREGGCASIGLIGDCPVAVEVRSSAASIPSAPSGLWETRGPIEERPGLLQVSNPERRNPRPLVEHGVAL